MSWSDPKLIETAQRFPTLRRVLPEFMHRTTIGTRASTELNLEKLAMWATTASSGERHAVAFVCHLYNDRAQWKCGKFDFFKAWTTWDDEHRAAFLAWAQDGWMP